MAWASWFEPPLQIAQPVRLERAGQHDRVVGAQPEYVAGPGQLRHPEAEPRLNLRRLEQSACHVVRRRQELADRAQALHRSLQGGQVADGGPGGENIAGIMPSASTSR